MYSIENCVTDSNEKSALLQAISVFQGAESVISNSFHPNGSGAIYYISGNPDTWYLDEIVVAGCKVVTDNGIPIYNLTNRVFLVDVEIYGVNRVHGSTGSQLSVISGSGNINVIQSGDCITIDGSGLPNIHDLTAVQDDVVTVQSTMNRLIETNNDLKAELELLKNPPLKTLNIRKRKHFNLNQ